VDTHFWAEHAWLPTGLARNVRIAVIDGRFAEVEVRTRRASGDVCLPGVVMPGFANGHSHVFHRALRGRSHTAPDPQAWSKRVYAAAELITPDSYLDLARAVYVEMLLAGYTAVGEFHYLHHGPDGRPYADPNAMSMALVKAAEEVGIRLTLIDVCYLWGGMTSSGHLPLDGLQERFSDGSVEAWFDRMRRIPQTDLLRRAAAIHSLAAITREQAGHVAALARELTLHEVPLHVNLSEKPADNLACQMYYGRTPTELFHDVGVLGPELVGVHAGNLSDHDIHLLAEARAQVVACPSTERETGHAVPPTRRLLDSGITVGIGSDHQVAIDPFLELRELEYTERRRSGERGRLSVTQLLDIGTRHGHQALGWYEGGAIVPGMLADLVAVDLASVRTVGSKAAEILYTATAADVLTVVVGGRVVVQNGEHVLGAVAPMLREAMQALRGQ